MLGLPRALQDLPLVVIGETVAQETPLVDVPLQGLQGDILVLLVLRKMPGRFVHIQIDLADDVEGALGNLLLRFLQQKHHLHHTVIGIDELVKRLHYELRIMGDGVRITPPTIDGDVQHLRVLGEEVGGDVEETVLVGPYLLIEIEIVLHQEIPPVNPTVDVDVVVVHDGQRPGLVLVPLLLQIELGTHQVEGFALLLRYVYVLEDNPDGEVVTETVIGVAVHHIVGIRQYECGVPGGGDTSVLTDHIVYVIGVFVEEFPIKDIVPAVGADNDPDVLHVYAELTLDGIEKILDGLFRLLVLGNQKLKSFMFHTNKILYMLNITKKKRACFQVLFSIYSTID